jgi:hypothetical protein|tara:strand:+ start:324 stop:611 length:288 start_codon:yes stop_codon:yes gene_type:complete
MIKYFQLFTFANTATVLLNANSIKSIIQTAATTTVLKYNSAADADQVTITHASDASGVAVQNFLIAHLEDLMSSTYTNAAPVITLPFAYASIGVS